MTAKNEVQPVNFGNAVVGPVELPKIDLDPYIGKDATIETIEEYEGIHGPYVKVSTGIVDTLKRGEKNIELKASKILGLVSLEQDGQNVIGWGTESKTAAFLKSKGVGHYRDLIGLKVKVQTQTTKEGQTFLSF